MGDTAWVFGLAILIVGVLIFVGILLTGKRGHNFNKEDYQTRFLKIENQLKQENPASYITSIIAADKLLDRALMEAGTPGKTMGDRLKKSSNRFEDINAVWRAHKLRNAVAHDPDLELGYKQTLTAISIYKQALKDLGAI